MWFIDLGLNLSISTCHFHRFVLELGEMPHGRRLVLRYSATAWCIPTPLPPPTLSRDIIYPFDIERLPRTLL